MKKYFERQDKGFDELLTTLTKLYAKIEQDLRIMQDKMSYLSTKFEKVSEQQQNMIRNLMRSVATLKTENNEAQGIDKSEINQGMKNLKSDLDKILGFKK